MIVLVHSPPIGFVVDIVNHWAEAVYHDVEPPGGRDYPSLHALGARHAVNVGAEVFGQQRTKALAAEYYELFAAAQPARVTLANELIRAADLSPELTKEGQAWVCARELRVEALLAAAVIRHGGRDMSLSRLGCCTAHGCRDAFVDGSQGNTREFCSARCQTRAKARRRRTYDA